MDISKASNFERFIFDLLSQDGKRTAALFKQVEETGGFDLSKRPCLCDDATVWVCLGPKHPC